MHHHLHYPVGPSNSCRQFILKLVAENTPFQHAIMNLPQNATDFLDVFIGLHSRLGADRSVRCGFLGARHLCVWCCSVG